VKIRVTWGFADWKRPGVYFIRKRGWIPDAARGARKLDTKEQVPEELFAKANVDAGERSNAGDVIAANYAARRQRELNDEGAALTRARPMSLRELGEFRLRKRKNEVHPATIERERGWLDALCRHLGDDADPSRLDIGIMEDYRDARLEDEWVPRLGDRGVRKISPRTVYNECSFAVALVAWGYARRKPTGKEPGTGMTEINITSVPQILNSEGRGGARKMSIDEFWRVYAAAARRPRAGAKSQVILALGFGTWLRADPLINLQRTWVDFVARTVTVPREFMKGGGSELTLPLNRFAMAAIERAIALHPNDKYVLPVNPQTGQPSSNLFHTLAAIAKDAGVRPFSLHSLRKLGATTILNHKCAGRHAAGINKIVGDKILAHAIPRNDAAYLGIDVETMRDALSVIDELWEERNRATERQVVELSARRA